MSEERRCEICETPFVSSQPSRKYCDEHKNPHDKRDGSDRRRLSAAERPPDYYKTPGCCAECGAEFVRKAAGERYCPEHAGRGGWERRNREKHLRRRREYMRRRRHGAEHGDPDIYERLVAERGEVCWICGISANDAPPTGRGKAGLCVDHDHATGVVRGLLCEPCNLALGWFRDDPERLRAALVYLDAG